MHCGNGKAKTIHSTGTACFFLPVSKAETKLDKTVTVCRQGASSWVSQGQFGAGTRSRRAPKTLSHVLKFNSYFQKLCFAKTEFAVTVTLLQSSAVTVTKH